MEDSNDAVSLDMETIYLGGKVILFTALMFGYYDSMISLSYYYF